MSSLVAQARVLDTAMVNKLLNTKEVTITLPTEFDDEQLPEDFIIKINKRKIVGKNALACDEIIFN